VLLYFLQIYAKILFQPNNISFFNSNDLFVLKINLYFTFFSIVGRTLESLYKWNWFKFEEKEIIEKFGQTFSRIEY